LQAASGDVSHPAIRKVDAWENNEKMQYVSGFKGDLAGEVRNS
jgi:hypothetical protein